MTLFVWDLVDQRLFNCFCETVELNLWMGWGWGEGRLITGHGAVLNADGEVELDAIIMDGSSLGSGAVSSVQNIANPVSLARAVMEKVPPFEIHRCFRLSDYRNKHATEVACCWVNELGLPQRAPSAGSHWGVDHQHCVVCNHLLDNQLEMIIIQSDPIDKNEAYRYGCGHCRSNRVAFGWESNSRTG